MNAYDTAVQSMLKVMTVSETRKSAQNERAITAIVAYAKENDITLLDATIEVNQAAVELYTKIYA